MGVPGGTEMSIILAKLPTALLHGAKISLVLVQGILKEDINHQIPNLKDVGHVKAPITLSENALQGFARPVAIKVMIHGTSRAQIIND